MEIYWFQKNRWDEIYLTLFKSGTIEKEGIKSLFTNIHFTIKVKSNHNHFFTLLIFLNSSGV